MNCRAFRTAHLDYTDRTLSAERLAAAQAHLEACGDCARFDALVRRSLMLVHSLPPVAPDSRFDPRLTARIARSRGVPERYLLPGTWLLAAASLAFVVGLASAAVLFHQPAATVASLPPVVALAGPSAPPPAPVAMPARGPLMRPDFMVRASRDIPLWSATSLIDEAPARFVSAQLASAIPAR